MTKQTKRFLVVIISLNLFTLSLTPSAESYDLSLPIKTVSQDQGNWCWAASIQAILGWYLKYPRQCDIANDAWGRSDCCVTPWSSYCDKGNLNYSTPPGGGKNVPAVLADWSVNGSGLSYPLSQANSVDEINAGRPFIIGLTYSTTGGHDIVGYGYELDGKYIRSMDPGLGENRRDLYTDVRYTYFPAGLFSPAWSISWTDSVQLTSNPRPGCQNWMALDVSPSGATLKGSVITTDPSSPVTIEYGTTTSYGSTVTADKSSVPGSTVITASKAITGLAPNTLYHFRAKAVSGGLTYLGSDQTFTTAPAPTYTLTVNYLGTGTGHVTSTSSLCVSLLTFFTQYTLTAIPDPGNTFTGWSGDCSGTGDCVVCMGANHSVSATFTPLETLTVSKLGTGTGAVTSSPAGISCGATCSNTFFPNTTVTLAATPDPGKIFTGWSGACSGRGSCTVTMNAPQTVSATFVPDITPILNLLLED